MPKKKLINEVNLTLDEAFDNFITHSESKNLSPSTIEYYKRNFKKFKDFLLKYDITHIDKLNVNLVEKYRSLLLEKNINDKTINSYLRAIRVFLKYCMRQGYLDNNFKVQLVKTEKKIKKTYTDKELKKLLKKPNLKECGFSEYRNWVMINWFLATGNRARTVRNVKIEDLDFSNGYVTLKKVKSRQQRIIPLSKVLIDIVQEYLQYRDGKKDEYLFSTIYGEKLSGDGLNSAITRYNKRRDVDKTSTHLFRHTFAKLWIKNGGDIFRLQKILGHSSMEMVRNYVNMYGEDLKDNFEEYNPINQFSNGSKDPIQMD